MSKFGAPSGLVFLLMVAVESLVPQTAVATPPTYLLGWGSNGTGDGQFIRPYCIAVGPGDAIYVADVFSPQVQIQKFNANGGFLTKWGTQGTAQGQIGEFVYSLAVAPSGFVYALDGTSCEVEITTGSGGYVGTFGAFGSGPGQLNFPEGIAIDSQGYVYIADTENARVQKFTYSGVFVTQWGSLGTGDGQFKKPYGIAVDAQGDIYVSDYDATVARVQKFTNTGAFILKFGSPGSGGDGLFGNPFGIAVDKYGHIFVADVSNNQVQVFNPDGSFLLRWGTTGTNAGQFNGPIGVAIGSDGSIYVADAFNDRVQKFAPSATPAIPSSWGKLKAQYRK